MCISFLCRHLCYGRVLLLLGISHLSKLNFDRSTPIIVVEMVVFARWYEFVASCVGYIYASINLYSSRKKILKQVVSVKIT